MAYSLTREYCVQDGKLYQVRHDWQHARPLWKLAAELPYYEDRNGTIAPFPIPAGDRIIITAYSPDGWLYLVSEGGAAGYIKITMDEGNGHWDYDPSALPGDRAMQEYLYEYGGVAG